MKTNFLMSVICAGVFLYGCGDNLVDSCYVLDLPEPPQAWETLLGSPQWQVEWVDVEGRKKTITIPRNSSAEIDLPQTWVSAISAMPFWPEKGIISGIFKPAGAIFPFDTSGKTLVLSWQGGVDAVLFWELARAYSGTEHESDEPETERAAVPRLPSNFNWPRFRQLFDDSSVNAEIRADPWLADWPGIAAKIVQSGFDKRRLVPEARSDLQVPVGRGPWIGASPFAAPLVFEDTPVFPVRPTADTWVSTEGILRCNTETWILLAR